RRERLGPDEALKRFGPHFTPSPVLSAVLSIRAQSRSTTGRGQSDRYPANGLPWPPAISFARVMRLTSILTAPPFSSGFFVVMPIAPKVTFPIIGKSDGKVQEVTY